MSCNTSDGRIASAARTAWGQKVKLALCAGASALTIAALSIVPSFSIVPRALANPQGGEVVAGDATITTPSTTQTQVNQSSDKAIIDWQSFNINANESTVFVQPNSSSVTLNRIFDNDPSIIAGLLSANGRLILINRNGLVFESGATVNTAGLIATTADIRNDDFLANRFTFDIAGNPNAQISNAGLITAEEGGVVAFVAPSVKNSGVITAKLGRVALGAGNTFVLDLYGDNLISFPVSAEIAQQLTGPDGEPVANLIDMSGKIEAGSVQLTARAARGIIDSVINVDGEIIASGITRLSSDVEFTGAASGAVYGRYGDAIVIDGGANGVNISGRLDASGAQGGSIAVTGSNVAVSGSLIATGASAGGGNVSIGGTNIALVGAQIEASGGTGGGSITVGHTGDGASRAISADTIFVSQGSTLKADALESGDGGRIVFWSNLATDFRGTVTAKGGTLSGDGGFLEISSKDEVGFWGSADASAPNGEAGLLLLDPKNLIISIAGLPLAGLTDPNQLIFAYEQDQTLTVNPAFLTDTLNTGTAVSLQANNDLTVASDIIVNRNFGDGGTLTLQAGRSVIINADIVTDDGSLFIIANELLAAGVVDAQRDPGDAAITMGAGAEINAGGGDVRITLASGAGKTNAESGDITLRDITAGGIIVENLGPSNGDVVIASGALTGTNTGSSVVLASLGGDFINNAGAGAISAANGRWIVYSQTPTANTPGGLPGTPYYNSPYNPANPTDFPADGDRFAYTVAPVLTVRADDLSRDYGDFNPDLTYSITGFIAGDDPELAMEGEPFVSTAATETSPAGSYAITVDLQTLASDYNYGFAVDDGVLTVVPAQLFYSAFGVTREYGEPNPDLDGEVIGFKLNDEVDDVVTGTLVFTTAGETGNVGSHAIDGSGLTVINSNYQLTILQDGPNATALEITPAQLTFIADPTTREYGDPNVFTGVVAGLKNGETLESVTSGTLAWTSSATPTSPLGIYEINGGGIAVTSGNYVATILQDPENATALTITPAQLFYLADPKSKTYGENNPVFTGTVTGLKNGDALEAVTDGTLVWISSAINESDAGVYEVFGSGLIVTDGNYLIDILQAPANDTAFTINQAQLIYRADPKSRIYGFPDPAFTGEVLGLTNGDSLENATSGDLVFTTPATGSSPAGIYGINGGGLTVASGNYIATILQDPGNATAFTIIGIPLTTSQTQQESLYSGTSAIDDAEGSTASRDNDLNIAGVAPVSIDVEDGKNDEVLGQLCVLGAPEAAKSPNCSTPRTGQ